MVTTIDRNSEEWRLECLRRHKARVERLKKAKTDQERDSVFRSIKSEVSVWEARSCWLAAFPKEADANKAQKA